MNLREWLVLYVKHKDAFQKKLKEVRERDGSIDFIYDDRTTVGYTMDLLAKPEQTEDVLIATLQKKENVRFLLDKWEAFSKHPGLTLIFVNPERNEKWLVKPAMHARVTDGKIEPGIWSMAEAVTWI